MMAITIEPFTSSKYSVTHQVHAVEKVCPVCGEKFTVYSEHHVYRIGTYPKTKKVCSWHCMRNYEMTHKLKSGKGARQNWRRSVPDALDRKKECEEKIAFYRQQFDNTTDTREKNSARACKNTWTEKLLDVNEYLKMKGVKV